MKKTIIILATLFSSAVFAQCEYKLNHVDEFTGEVKKKTKMKRIGVSKVGKLYSSGVRVGDNVGLYFRFSEDLGCLTRKSKVIIKFTDSTTTTLRNIADISCKDTPTMIAFIKDKSELMKRVEKIRISYDDYYSDCVIKDQNYFIQTLECLK